MPLFFNEFNMLNLFTLLCTEKPEDHRSVYLAYDEPKPRARTGHLALFVTEPTEFNTAQNIIYFYSLYHNLKPDQLRKLSLLGKIRCRVQAYTVESYNDEVTMRGQSWLRFDKRQKEEETTQNLVETLTQDKDLRNQYFKIGQYQHIIKLDSRSLDIDKVIAHLEKIKSAAYWGMFSPLLSKVVSLNSNTENCCSAISAALNAGNTKVSILKKITPLIALFSLYLAYQSPQFTRDKNPYLSFAENITIPYLLIRCMISMHHALNYADDIISMAKDKETVSYSLSFAITALSILINAVGSPVTTKACSSLFKFPANFYREAMERPGSYKVQYRNFIDISSTEKDIAESFRI
ncbi:MAG: hypothetical protein NTZ67_01280 [Gammaproteobacteria bacterium]|nr:hypothetical protein [Gammaproteobacteria bacterium]